MDIHFLEAQYGSDDYRTSCDLRDELLRKPLGMSLFDQDLGEEKDFIHLIGKNEEQELIAYLQFKKIEERTLKMQQVVVAEHAQGKRDREKARSFFRAICYYVWIFLYNFACA